ncbi:MAG: ribosome recycling factor [Candidatus Omnitrophica bacterium]|nr:ribosome recycling factor [Candidatus Omnitrophota bacterium]MCM8798508.1 ribosome recycling factor [Candidatus Omnitrophota bacterium]
MATIKEILHQTEEKMKKTVEVTQREFATVRTSRASPTLLDHIKINYYGTPTPLRQLATISVPEPKLLIVQTWDPSLLPEVEKEILKANLGLNPVNDGKVLKLPIPPLSKERREELLKVVKKMAEGGKIAVRSIRHDANEQIKKMEKDKLISEDDSFRNQEEVQKLTEKYIKQIDEIVKAKEKEILEI